MYSLSLGRFYMAREGKSIIASMRYELIGRPCSR